MPPPSRPRLPAIAGWLQDLGLAPRSVDSLTGDISLRRYFRVHLADGGTARGRLLPGEAAAGVPPLPAHQPAARRGRRCRCRRSVAADCRRGLMLLEDTGDRTLYERAAARLGRAGAAPIAAPPTTCAASRRCRASASPRSTRRLDADAAALGAAQELGAARWCRSGLVGPPAVGARFRRGARRRSAPSSGAPSAWCPAIATSCRAT